MVSSRLPKTAILALMSTTTKMAAGASTAATISCAAENAALASAVGGAKCSIPVGDSPSLTVTTPTGVTPLDGWSMSGGDTIAYLFQNYGAQQVTCPGTCGTTAFPTAGTTCWVWTKAGSWKTSDGVEQTGQFQVLGSFEAPVGGSVTAVLCSATCTGWGQLVC